LDSYFSSSLDVGRFPGDVSRNGVQVANGRPGEKQLTKLAFAVDACLETITRAAEAGADLLFVHHGILWGQCESLVGPFRCRIKALLDSDLALYACHLPLDAHPVLGNNYGLALKLGMQHLEPFGQYHGAAIGVQGELPAPLGIDELRSRLFPGYGPDLRVYPFGKTRLTTVGIVSGGAGDLVDQAASAGLDCYVTGEVHHEQYHLMEELGITVIACGHYRSETVGVGLVQKQVERDLGLATTWLDLPTGM
jgi:dinuclear metal center YbgI/SA1388 family protein